MSGDDRDEPPIVLATLMAAASRAEAIVRRVIQSIPFRVQMFLWGGGAVAVFVLILSLSLADEGGWEGALRGVFGGAFLALLDAAAMGWMLLWARGSSSPRRFELVATPGTLDTMLSPTLRELNAVRGDVIRKVRARSIIRIPLGIAAAIVFWLVAQTTDDPPSVFELLLFVVFGAIGGEMWAIGKLEREYHRLYKSRVLPVLASRFGALTYTPAGSDDVRKLRAFRILPDFDSVRAEDEISGTHRGLGVRIIEARLERRARDST